MIVQLYLSEKDEKPLLTVGRVRQHISYDAYWLMKIHLYLSNLGVINAGMMSLDQEVIDHDYVLKGGEHGQRELLASEYDLSLKIPYGSSGDIL